MFNIHDPIVDTGSVIIQSIINLLSKQALHKSAQRVGTNRLATCAGHIYN